MKKVLVAADFSIGSDEALRQGNERLGKKDRLIVCHVLPVIPSEESNLIWSHLGAAYSLPEFRRKVLSGLRKRIEKVTGRKIGKYEIILGEGNPAAMIVSKAEEIGVDLIVIGSHGASGFTRFLIGSVADRVIRHAHCPVLLARTVAGSGKILVATDFSDPSLPAVAAGAEESRRTGAPIAILHSIEDVWPLSVYSALGITAANLYEIEMQQRMLQQIDHQLDKALKSQKVKGEKFIEYGPPAPAILRTAEMIHARMIVVGSIGRTGLPRLVLGSTSEKVAHAAECPVMVVRLTR